jgi:hypothetical protein
MHRRRQPQGQQQQTGIASETVHGGKESRGSGAVKRELGFRI